MQPTSECFTFGCTKGMENVQEEITICLADTHYLARVGLKQLLSERPHYRITAEIGDEAELLQYLAERATDLVILDYDQPEYFSVHTIKQIRAAFPAVNILVISSDSDRKNIDLALEYGVNSYLTKSCDKEEIFDALKAAQKGDKYFCTKILDYILEKSFSRPLVPVDAVPLTGREIEIVQLISKGLIAKEIGNMLNLSTHTVYTHRKNIMKKLQMNSLSELMLYALNKGLIVADESDKGSIG